MEQESSNGNSHQSHMASPIPSGFDLLVMPQNLQLQEGNYLGNNSQPSPLDSFPLPTLPSVTQEPGQSFGRVEIMPNGHTRSTTRFVGVHQRGLLDGSNMSSEHSWNNGGNYSDQSWLIPRPPTPYPHGEMGLHGDPHLTHQQEEIWITFDEANPFEAYSGSHQFIDESSLNPFALDAQYSSSVTPEQAMAIWNHGMHQQQINDQVLTDASDANINAALDISMSLPEPSIPYWQSLYAGQPVQPNQLPILGADSQNHYSTMHHSSMMTRPQYTASYEQVNQAPFVQSFANDADAGIMFLPPALSIPQSPHGISDEVPPIIPNLDQEQSQFMNPEMIDVNTQEQSQPWPNVGPTDCGFHPQSNISEQTTNSVYDPMYETIGLPIDPHLRMFLASEGGNPTWQSNSEQQLWRFPDK